MASSALSILPLLACPYDGASLQQDGAWVGCRHEHRFPVVEGVPMVLNTSFNENEPVVCRPQEALDCFLRTRMDLLVLGRWVISRGPHGG